MNAIARVPGPWGREGTKIKVDKDNATHQHYLNNGVLEEVSDLTPKEIAIAQAELVGVSTEGTQAEIEDRIEAAQSGAEQG